MIPVARDDYILAGSGLSSLVFAALAAKAGARVHVLEAHEHFGGYGHTFQMGSSAKFNAQLHYVWNCGEGDTVNDVLSSLGLAEEVQFERLDAAGFDRMCVPGFEIKIGTDMTVLEQRLDAQVPGHRPAIRSFLQRVGDVALGLGTIASPKSLQRSLRDGPNVLRAARHMRDTLQQVFDLYSLPLPLQSLLASQWPDFLLPPDKLSFYAWVMLFTGYQRGAFYPTRHFEHVIDSLVDIIRCNGGQICSQQEVTGFILEGDRVAGVQVRDLRQDKRYTLHGQQIISNMDPKRSAEMIGLERFSPALRKKLDYEYSPSNFMIYCTVDEGLDLRAHGFGAWNTFHSCDLDLNRSFRRMYDDLDYSQPSFALTTPSLMTSDTSDRPAGEQVLELLTVANHSLFSELLQRDRKAYLSKKKEIVNHIFDQVEAHYLPDFRRHIRFKISGSPTTNERFCWAPAGNSYGANMTPEHMGLGRLNHNSSIEGLHFCNASAGFPGFAGAFWNGRSLYRQLLG